MAPIVAWRPRRRSDLTFQRAGQDTLLYDPVADAVHVLNPTAWAIWELCDGQYTPDEMAACLRTRFAPSLDYDVSADVAALLTTFAERCLLDRQNETTR
jgi:hypothetical protein